MVKHCIFVLALLKLVVLFMLTKRMNARVKKWMIAIFILLIAAAAVIWYMFTLKHDDTATVHAAYTVEAISFLKEFETDLSAANKKYSEQIVTVNGTVSEIEMADTSANIKMIDTTNGSYIIFAFQKQHLAEAKALTTGEQVSIKGSCSNGAYSAILETNYIAFKRCALNK